MQRKETLPIDKAYEAAWVSQDNVGALNAIIKNLVFAYLMEETKEGSWAEDDPVGFWKLSGKWYTKSKEGQTIRFLPPKKDKRQELG